MPQQKSQKHRARRFSDYLDHYPPCVCRIIARTKSQFRRTQSLTNAEIAAKAGMTVNEVRLLSSLTSWDNVTVDQMWRFSRACGLDFNNPYAMNRTYYFILRKSTVKWQWLWRSREWESFLKPLIIGAGKQLKVFEIQDEIKKSENS